MLQEDHGVLNAKIPRKMEKIFTCSEHEHLFGDDPMTGGHQSVKSRFNLLDVNPGDLARDIVRRLKSLM